MKGNEIFKSISGNESGIANCKLSPLAKCSRFENTKVHHPSLSSEKKVQTMNNECGSTSKIKK